MSKLIWLLVLASYLCEGYKILVVYPFPARSHNNLGNGVVRHLLKAGHEVTYITPFPLKQDNPNLKQIDVSSNIGVFPEKALNIHALMTKQVDLRSDNFAFFYMLDVAKSTMKNEGVQMLLNDPSQRFDLIVMEWMFNELYSGFSTVFDCPYIWTFPYEPHAKILSMVDEVSNPAYHSNMASNNVPPFTFVQRVEELWWQTISMLKNLYYYNYYEVAAYEEFFKPILARRGKELPSYEVVRYNASMILGNTHVSCGQAMRLPQSFKVIAGYYIDDEVKPLPQELQILMDNAKHGVIYFSLGSNLKSKDLAPEIKKGLIKILGELKQTVIWKFEEDFPNLPKNVHILNWAPQQSILAHPNCIMFITHGGLLSTTETLHFGVPTIGIPVFQDQFNNVYRAARKGFTIRVDISYNLANDLKNAINEMLTNPKYTEKVKLASFIYHDRPVPPGRELVHWVEHVIRTGGAPHLRSPALDVPLYQKMYLDLLALIVFILFIFKKIVTTIICSPTKKNNKEKKVK